jgi:lambda family phage portal protein
MGKAKAKASKPIKKKPEAGNSRKYEGASKSKRLSRWQTQSTSAIAEISQGLITLRNRSRDLRRNNPYAAKAIQVITSNVVGTGISTQFRGPNAKPIEDMWNAWAESKSIDFDGRNNIYGLQRLIMDAVSESGEVLVRKRISSVLNFPLQYQILESDFLDTTKTEPGTAGNYVVQGVEFDPQGRRVAYFLYEEHPGSYNTGAIFSQKSNRVPASDVKHIFRMDRPGQARGVPWLAPIIVRLKDLDDYEDAQLMRQKIAACFTAFIRDITADLDSDEDCGDDLSDRLEPGLIEHLPPGKMIEFTKPPEVQNYKEYTSTVLHSIAAGVGITYEALTGDLSQVNFSSARMGWLEFGRNLKAWREHVLIAHGLDPIAEDFLEIADIMGMNIQGVTYIHVAPTREMIDPTKEVPATIDAIRAGLTTLSDELMAQGKDPAQFLQQYKADQDLLDKLGLKIESDPRVAKDSGAQGGVNGQTQDQNSGQSA